MYVIALLLSFLVACCLAAEECIPSTNEEFSSCACKLNTTNKYFNLSPLQNSSVVPRFTTNTSEDKNGWHFSYNPCKSFDMFLEVTDKHCEQVAVARWISPSKVPNNRTTVCTDLGDQRRVVFDTTPVHLSKYGYGWSNMTLKFLPEQSKETINKNEAVIHLICNANMTEHDGDFHYLNTFNAEHSYYYFALESRCSCPGLCGEPPSAEECIPSTNEEFSSCACKLNTTNKYFNLSPLQNSSLVPRFTTNTSEDKNGWHFSYNPCKPFDMFLEVTDEHCEQVAVARWISPSKVPNNRTTVCTDLGDQRKVVFDTTPVHLSKYGYGWSNMTLKFLPRQSEETINKNEAVIHLICNANMTEHDGEFHYLNTTNAKHSYYYFALESRCSCPGLCGEPPSGSHSKPSKDDDDMWLIIGLSIGGVILLLLIILAVICCKKEKRGYAEV